MPSLSQVTLSFLLSTLRCNTNIQKKSHVKSLAEEESVLGELRPGPYTRLAKQKSSNKLTLSNGMEFMRVPAGKFTMGSKSGDNDEMPQHTVNISYDYWMARFPVTNEVYNFYAKANKVEHLVSDWERRIDHPVVNVKSFDISEYCGWLNNILETELPSDMVLRLPTESEWEKAARGIDKREYPWGNTFDKNKCNSEESGTGNTSPVAFYSPHGDSPYGCADMAGNVWEWTHSLKMKYPYKNNDGREDDDGSELRILRGGSFINNMKNARCSYRGVFVDIFQHGIGFRLVLAPPLS